MFSVHVSRKRNSAEVHASGDLVLEHVREFVDTVRTVIEKKSIVIDLTEIERVDLAGLQTLFAIKKGEDESGYSATLEFGDNRDRIRKISEFAGLRMIDDGADDVDAEK